MNSSSVKLPKYYSETGTQLLERLSRRDSLGNFDHVLFPEGLKDGEIIEINGPSGIGKTQFLMRLIVRCITPKTWKTYHIGGLEIGVSYIDTDHHFPMLKLIVLLECCLKSSLNKEDMCTAEEMHEFVTFCLGKLSITSCFDSLQLSATLQQMSQTSDFSKWDCKVLMIDSLSAFYWEDEMMKIRTKYELINFYGHLSSIIQKLSDSARYTVLFTRLSIKKFKFTQDDTARCNPSNQISGGNDEDYNYLGKEVQKLPKWKVTLSKIDRELDLVNVNVAHNSSSCNTTFKILDCGFELT